MKVRFAHLTLAGQGGATISMLRHAATTVRQLLNARGVDACIVLDGPNVVLWIPIDGAPTDIESQTWLQGVIFEAKSRRSDLFEADPRNRDARVRISMTQSLPGYGVRLPYAIIPGLDLGLALPITWRELQTLSWNTFNVKNIKSRIVLGDVFADEIARIGVQRVECGSGPTSQSGVEIAPMSLVSRPDQDLLLVAREVLADGKARSIGQIMEEAAQRDLWPETTRVEYARHVIRAYIEETTRRNAWPHILLREDDYNLSVDLGGDDLFGLIESEPLENGSREVVDRLNASSGSHSDRQFADAVEACFAQLGFHVVIPGDGDGFEFFADAQLGALSYRVVVRCVSDGRSLTQLNIAQCVRFRNAYVAEYTLIVSPGFEKVDDSAVADAAFEGIKLWRVQDLTAIMERRPDLQELSATLNAKDAREPAEALELSATRRKRRRSAVIATAIVTAGTAAQQRSAEFHSSGQAALLTEAAALELVKDWLRARGSLAKIENADIQDALDFLADPRVGAAVRIPGQRQAIVILHEPLSRVLRSSHLTYA
jgi:hypothetical protein